MAAAIYNTSAILWRVLARARSSRLEGPDRPRDNFHRLRVYILKTPTRAPPPPAVAAVVVAAAVVAVRLRALPVFSVAAVKPPVPRAWPNLYPFPALLVEESPLPSVVVLPRQQFTVPLQQRDHPRRLTRW